MQRNKWSEKRFEIRKKFIIKSIWRRINKQEHWNVSLISLIICLSREILLNIIISELLIKRKTPLKKKKIWNYGVVLNKMHSSVVLKLLI